MAGRGPLPKPAAQRRRRNQPTIPTTSLPASGRKGAAPKPPAAVELRARGKAWWAWAWKTPQAAAWSAGDHYALARRAALEDDLRVLDDADSLELPELADARADEVRSIVGRLAAMATGRLQIMREMRELDDRFGLTPKALAALRWEIVDDQPAAEEEKPQGVVRRLRAVDPTAVAGA